MVKAIVSGEEVSMKKKTKGRKKIEIKKIKESNSRQVTFSKRRAGLFKKASELCVLTGAQIAIFVNSPGGRVFTFGHPNADHLIDRYLNEIEKPTTNATTTAVNGGCRNSQPPLPMMKMFNQHFVKFSKELEIENKRRELIIPTVGSSSSSDGLRWYEKDVDGMEVEELEEHISSLQQLRKKVLIRADELTMIKKTPAALSGSNPFDQMVSKNNNNMQTSEIPTTAVHGGFNFHHGGGEIGIQGGSKDLRVPYGENLVYTH